MQLSTHTQKKERTPGIYGVSAHQKQRGRGWAAPLLGFTVVGRWWDLGAARLLGFTVVGRRWDLGAAGQMGFTMAGGRRLRACGQDCKKQESGRGWRLLGSGRGIRD
jgi:hypothetical protein